MNGTIYNAETGEIYTAMMGPDEESIKIQLPLYDNPAYVLDEFLASDKWYLPGGVKTERPTMDVQCSQTVSEVQAPILLTNIPKGTRVIGQVTSKTPYPTNTFDVTVDDGTLEWSSLYPGTYTIELICFPYQTMVITLEITNLRSTGNTESDG